jgi:predicted acylesterase/phospholipase RssA
MQGGGCRSFFQLGVLEVAGGVLGPFEEVGAVSASTAMACAHLLGVHGEAHRRFAARVGRNRRNFYPGRLLAGRRLTPHAEMFRETVLECVDARRLAALRAHPSRLRFLVGVGPLRSRALAVALATTTVITKRPSPLIAPHVIDVRDLATPEALADAILASSAFPPFTPLPIIGGRAAIDGGVVQSVPLRLVSARAHVTALLTRPRPWRPLPPSVRVIAPAHTLPVALWDYADAARITATYDAGRRAGERIVSASGTS